MKKGLIVGLAMLGAGLGYWMAQENWRLFEVAHPVGQVAIRDRPVDYDFASLERGLETWQVKEFMGPPDSRSVLEGKEAENREEWRYGDRRLFFSDGVLVSWDE